MVNWLAIEDVAEVPSRVWLSRDKETDEWKPLRKVDCKALNESSTTDGRSVLIQYGRATAEPDIGVIKYNYYPRPVQQLISASWFVRLEDPKDKQRHILEPITDVPTTMAIEELYQHAVHAASSLGDGIDNILKEQVPISEDHHVAVERSSDGHYLLRKIPNGTWFRGRGYDLQRGYGSYTVPGEEEEAQLGPVKHLIFVVHGIGEAMWSREDVTYTGSLIDDITNYRLIMQKRQVAEWKKEREQAQKERNSPPPPPARVELIPILWYDRVHSSSSSLMKSLKSTTLTTIPALREIANDVIFDVLMYLTPNFCYDVLECVTDQIIRLNDIFQKNHPHFVSSGGKSSLMGHSLGSVICWDLLSILNDSRSTNDSSSSLPSDPATQQKGEEHGVHISSDGHTADVGYQNYASDENADQAKNGSFGPSLPKRMKRVLPFEPHHTIFLGSPIGLFLTLRGAHPVFDAMRDNLPDGPGKPRTSPFRLPTSTVHNIFHPSDPVAYRIEPLLLAQGMDQDELPPPLYLTREGEGVRLHVKAKQFGDQIRKSISEQKSTLSSFMSVMTDQAHTLLKQMDDRTKIESLDAAAANKKPKAQVGGKQETEAPLSFPLAGRTGRLDYQLQPNVIDSEYVSAVLAHSSYFANTDVIDYTIDLTRIRTPQQPTIIDLTGDNTMAGAII